MNKKLSPQELKARAIAMQIQGYSSRYVANELRQQLPQRIPHYTTIARWLQQAKRGPQGTRAARRRWAAILERAGIMVIERLDEADRMSPVGIAKMYGTVTDVYLALDRSMR